MCVERGRSHLSSMLSTNIYKSSSPPGTTVCSNTRQTCDRKQQLIIMLLEKLARQETLIQKMIDLLGKITVPLCVCRREWEEGVGGGRE